VSQGVYQRWCVIAVWKTTDTRSSPNKEEALGRPLVRQGISKDKQSDLVKLSASQKKSFWFGFLQIPYLIPTTKKMVKGKERKLDCLAQVLGNVIGVTSGRRNTFFSLMFYQRHFTRLWRGESGKQGASSLLLKQGTLQKNEGK
jgi:hypothetical protein